MTPDGHLRGGRAVGAMRPRGDRHLPPAVLQDFGASDVDLGAGRRFVADHQGGARAAPCRADALPVHASGDDHPFAWLEHLGGLADRAEGGSLVAGPLVVGIRRALVHIVGPGEGQRLLPLRELGSVGQAWAGGVVCVVGRRLRRGQVPTAAWQAGEGRQPGGTSQQPAPVDLPFGLIRRVQAAAQGVLLSFQDASSCRVHVLTLRQHPGFPKSVDRGR